MTPGYARAITNETGSRVYGDSLGAGNSYKYDINIFGRGRRDPMYVPLGSVKWEKGYVGDLLQTHQGRFNLVGNYMINELGILANTPCRFCLTGILRVVQTESEDIRSDSINIFRKCDEAHTSEFEDE